MPRTNKTADQIHGFICCAIGGHQQAPCRHGGRLLGSRSQNGVSIALRGPDPCCHSQQDIRPLLTRLGMGLGKCLLNVIVQMHQQGGPEIPGFLRLFPLIRGHAFDKPLRRNDWRRNPILFDNDHEPIQRPCRKETSKSSSTFICIKIPSQVDHPSHG